MNSRELKTNSRLREYARIRSIITWISQEFGTCTLTKVAEYFNRDVTGLSRAMRDLNSDSEKRAELEKIKPMFYQKISQQVKPDPIGHLGAKVINVSNYTTSSLGAIACVPFKIDIKK